jgi:hypothetical protein
LFQQISDVCNNLPPTLHAQSIMNARFFLVIAEYRTRVILRPG